MRGDSVESRHQAFAGLCEAETGAESDGPAPDVVTFWRSALKPFQALPLVEDGALEALGLGDEELAVCCGSHGGRAEHLATVQRILARLDAGPDALYCGPHPPYDADAASELRCAGRRPGALHNNCSGKHAGMLALARRHGWDPDGYWRLDHPVQQRIREALRDWIDVDPDGCEWATDGCGVPTVRLPLVEMARAYGRLVRRARDGHGAAAAVVAAMTRRPDLTSSPGRAPLELMRAAEGRLLAKEGAEGVLCAAGVDGGWGLAVKVEDGGLRAIEPTVVAVLERRGLLPAGDLARLQELGHVTLRNTLGAEVGRIDARFTEREAPRGEPVP
ncbi:MAG: asparaginase [Gemmatimonadota bacterium]|nr:asparaginase [Gemmatimonadota bacterium]